MDNEIVPKFQMVSNLSNDPLQLRVILISSAVPEPTYAGHLVLHRHLAERNAIEFETLFKSPESIPSSAFGKRIAQTRLHRFVHDFLVFRSGRYLDRDLCSRFDGSFPTVVMTVAQGFRSMAAVRFAVKNKLPLVTFFHDWWPDMLPVHSLFKRMAERQFRNLYRSSDLAFCVSPGMQLELGEHSNSHVLYPIPAEREIVRNSSRTSNRFRVVYAGNLFTYGAALMEAMEALKDDPTIRLEVRGSNPNWPISFCNEMRSRGMWLDFAPRAELEAWLSDSDAFLIPQCFSASEEKSMKTNFPSKIVDFCSYGKPFIVWAPIYASAAVWADGGRRAELVSSPCPNDLVRSIRALQQNTERRQVLAQSSTEEAKSEFKACRIQDRFLQLLNAVVNKPRMIGK